MSKTTGVADQYREIGRLADEIGRAMRAAFPEVARAAAATTHRTKSEAAVETLADYLYFRDWPSATPRERHAHIYGYQCQAAAILAGEAWAIRKAWPEAAHEIQTRSDWSA